MRDLLTQELFLKKTSYFQEIHSLVEKNNEQNCDIKEVTHIGTCREIYVGNTAWGWLILTIKYL